MTRHDRRAEALRAERQKVYTRFVSLADELIMALEDDWHKLSRLAFNIKAADDMIAKASGSDTPEDAKTSVLEGLSARRDAKADELRQLTVQLDSERLRPQADIVRAARVELEIVGSDTVALHALTISQMVYAVLADIGDPEKLADVPEALAIIRGERTTLLKAARDDAQLR